MTDWKLKPFFQFEWPCSDIAVFDIEERIDLVVVPSTDNFQQ